MNRRSALTLLQRQRLALEAEAGLTRKEAAAKVGVSLSTVRRFELANDDVTFAADKRGGREQAEIAEGRRRQILQLQAAGLTQAAVAAETKLSVKYVGEVLRANGVNRGCGRMPAPHLEDLTAAQRADYETLCRLGGYRAEEALTIVTRPREKIRLVTEVRA